MAEQSSLLSSGNVRKRKISGTGNVNNSPEETGSEMSELHVHSTTSMTSGTAHETESPYRTAPSCTSDWKADEVLCNRLLIKECCLKEPLQHFMTWYINTIQDESEAFKLMHDTESQMFIDYKIREACYKFVLCEWKSMFIDCESLSEINIERLLEFNEEMTDPFNNSFEESSLYTDFVLKAEKQKSYVFIPMLHNFQCNDKEEMKRIVLIRNTCNRLYHKLPDFLKQLRYLVGADSEKRTEKMFQGLFMSFIDMFGLDIFDRSNDSEIFQLHIGEETVKSIPDALIMGFNHIKSNEGILLENKVLAVVEVTKEGSSVTTDSDEEPRRRKLRHTDKTIETPVAHHLDNKLKGPHIGEMLAVTESESSYFGLNGVYGFIVQGTKVTLSCLCSDAQYIQDLRIKGKPKMKANVYYSMECNMLLKNGRMQLIDVLLGLYKLLQVTQKESEGKGS